MRISKEYVEKLEAKLADFEEVLEFYGDEDEYDCACNRGSSGKCWIERGDKALSILKKHKEKQDV